MKSFKEARQDPHRPSVLDPSEYVYVGCADDHGGDSYFEMNHGALHMHGIPTPMNNPRTHIGVPWYDATEDGRPNYRCHHCGKHGSNIRYFTFFLHKPTKVVITVGQICAKKLNLGTKAELDLQKRANAFRASNERNRWAQSHEEEYNFLASYHEARQAGGRYNEFFTSLWEQISERGSLSGKQVEALRQGMERERRWQAENADRKLSHVTRVEDEPTKNQLAFIEKLARDLDQDVEVPLTRSDASDLINSLKAQYLRIPTITPTEAPATDKQLSFINSLLDQVELPTDKRREARVQFDAGLTKAQASRWIERLKALPKVGAAA